MLQTFDSQSDAFYEGGGARQALGLGHYIGILKRRWLRAALAFTVVLLLGAFITAIQKPIYEFEGKVLVESQQIPSDLVSPTVTDTAIERIKVIQQRIMTRDNLLGLVKKYNMFPGAQRWMSESDLLDLMRQQTSFDLVNTDEKKGNQNTTTIAFTVTFDYENPEIAQRVANEYLTLILAEDARNRINRAEETTSFLASESQRLQAQQAAIEAQIAAVPADERISSAQAALDPSRYSAIDLTKLKDDLAQKSSIYSDAHPYIITLKKKIAAMEALVAKTSSQTAAVRANGTLVDLQRKQLDAEKALQENNQKLEQARLGEKMERDQQSERLQVIEQPALPQVPVKPSRVKFLIIAFALALAAGLGVIVVSEALDGSIRHSRELLAVAQGRMIVSIPYIATRAETLRRKGLLAIVLGIIAVCLLAGIIGFLFFGPPIDLSWVNQYMRDSLTRLTK